MANEQEERVRPFSTRRRPLPADAREQLSLQRDQFGGIHWGSAFFGWLSANGLAVLVLAVVSAAGIAIGLTTEGGLTVNRQAAKDTVLGADPAIGLAGGIVALLVVATAYFAGGYVAGRMSRFDGARQGFAVWVIGVVAVALLGFAGSLWGAEFNVLNRLDLPRIPVDEGTATRGAVIALVAILVVSAVAAVLGGKAGEHYHRKVDRSPFTG
jgi:hypothetical protein